jgi:hypothetical protein
MALLALLLFLAQDVPAPVAEQIRRLRSDDFAERVEAKKKLIEHGKEAVGALEQLLKDPDADVVWHAEAILREIDHAARLKAIREPEKRTSVELRDVPLMDAVQSIFQPFGLQTRIGAGNTRAGQPLTLKLERATFWEAWDAIYLRTSSMGLSAEPIPGVDKSRELVFVGPFREIVPNTTATVGDYRILVGPTGLSPPKGPAACGVHMVLVCPDWAVPKKANIVDLALGNSKIRSELVDDRGINQPNDRAVTGCIRRVVRWQSVDYVPRTALGPDNTIKVSATLVLTLPGKKGDQETAAPFSIEAFPMLKD